MRSAEVVVNDLRSIEVSLDPSCGHLKNGLDFAEARNLTIVLRMSSRTLKELQMQPQATIEESYAFHNLSNDEKTALSLWKDLTSTIKKLKNLRKLRIWLEPSDPISWSNFKERKILRAVEPLAKDPSLELWLDLPRHCQGRDNVDVPPFKIERQRRMRYYSNGYDVMIAACRCGAYLRPCINREEDYSLEQWRVELA